MPYASTPKPLPAIRSSAPTATTWSSSSTGTICANSARPASSEDALLLLQLANISVYHATRGEYPLFLLDDIDAELDYRRIGQLLDFLHGKTQTFVTTSKESFVEKFGVGANVSVVTGGTAKSL